MSELKLSQIAARINAHLKRFESDPKINKPKGRGDHVTSKYWHAGSWQAGRFVYVRYVSYQGDSHLTRTQAEDYLSWLDARNVGTHYQMGNYIHEYSGGQ